jgi:FAD/FMN-containing dehydrogenase
MLISGLGSSTGELSINLENLQNFSMDESTFVATVGAGLRIGDIDELMYNAGQRFIPHGTSAHVGIGGHGTVGGAGFAWRQYGLTIDYIQEVEVVLANSTIVKASASQNADLFFAIRGAGAGFGIVTEFIFNTLPAPSQTVSFAYLWTATDTPTRAEIFKAWQDWTTNSSLPSEVQTVIGVAATTIFMSGAYFGTLDAFNALGIPSLFPPAQQSSTEVFTNWLQLSRIWAEQVTQSGRETPAFFYVKSIVFRPETSIPDSVVDKVFEYLATTNSGTENWDIEIQAGGGYDATIPASATAFPHRDASFVWLSYAATNGSVMATTTAFLDGLHVLVKSGHPDEYYGEYAGFIDAKEQPDKARYAYWGPNLQRLGQIKAAYDPLDVFHNRQSVLPGGSSG